jgi:hypothetical protein
MSRIGGHCAKVVGTVMLAATVVGGATTALVVGGATPAQAASVCTFNGHPSTSILTGVTAGASIAVHCTGLPDGGALAVAEAPELAGISQNQIAEADIAAAHLGNASATGTLDLNYTLPNPYKAQDANAVCPPSQAQINAGLGYCLLAVATFAGVDYGSAYLQYSSGAPVPQTPTLALNPTTAKVGQAVKVLNGAGPGQWWGNALSPQPISASNITIGGVAAASSTASIAAARYPVKGTTYGPLVNPAPGGSFIVPCGTSGAETVTMTEPNSSPIPGAISASAQLTVTAGAIPAVTGLTPPRGPQTGGTSVTIKGCNFTKVKKVMFGTTPATSFTVNSTTSITAMAPAGTGVVNVVVTSKKGSSSTSPATAFAYGLQGYDLVGSDGNVYGFGAQTFGSELGKPHAPIVGMAATPDGAGYWLVGNDGGVFRFGDAPFEGSLPGRGIHPAAPIVAIVATPDGKGYWLIGRDGGVFGFGDAPYEGSLPGQGITPAAPIVGAASSPDGHGYWLVGADGGVFRFGDAPNEGSLPGRGIHPAAPIVGMAATSDGAGYWLAGSDGGVFGLGDAPFEGSLPSKGITPHMPVVGISSPDSGGYYLVAGDGGVFNMGDAPFKGSAAGGSGPTAPIVGVTGA